MITYRKRRGSMNKKSCFAAAALSVAMVVVGASASAAEAARDAMRGPELKDVKLGGYASEKMNALFEARMLSKHAQRDVFGEARRAFERRDDDLKGYGGVWRGEFWGKLMLGTARVAQCDCPQGLPEGADDLCPLRALLAPKNVH